MDLKALFFQSIRGHFRAPENMERLATVFLGSACEQWLNAEVFQAILAKNPTIWVRPEQAKGDLVIYGSADSPEPAVVLESKVLYSIYTWNDQRVRLESLGRQLRARKNRFKSARVAGLVVAFEWEWARANETSTEWNRPRARSHQPGLLPLRERHKILRNAFGHPAGFRPLRNHPIQMGAYKYRVSCSLELLEAT